MSELVRVPSPVPTSNRAAADSVSGLQVAVPRFGSRRMLCLLAVFSIPLFACSAEDTPAKKSTSASKTEREAPATSDKKTTEAGKPAKPEEEDAPENPFPRRFKAPELDGGTGWLNTGGEITLKDLRGKIVLLDFWTYCCINCMHVLPDLKYLEKKYDKQLVVIGVHSAKFDNEKDTENIRRAIMRYEIEHPVINDSEMVVWRKFGVNAWPSLVLLDPEGYYCGYISGEGNREVLEQVLDKVIAYHKSKGTLDESPVKFDLEHNRAKATPLRFPGKILADEPANRLFISDSNHNRIVIASLDGKLKEVIGAGAIGKADGAYDKATFDHPQGMALVGETLYVADTENHLLRAVDLAKKTVTTIAGTGEQGHERRRGGEGTKVALNSPWDLVHFEGKLYIAMAGPHQLWTYDLKKHTVQPYAGSGREDIVNGPLDVAAMAQPSGITTDGKFLYVVDSEGSALRKVPLDPDGEMTTLVGTSDLPRGRSLFEFGDKDGIGGEARLQHPLGVLYHDGTLYVADSYNHKIKQVDPESRESKTYLGDGKAGDRNDPPRFSEPAGLTVAGGKLYVADTNNHQIRTVDLKSGKTATLTIDGLTPPKPQKSSTSNDLAGRKPIMVPAQKVAASDSLSFEIALAIPEGYKLNKLAPITYRVTAPGAQDLIAAAELNQRQEAEEPTDGKSLQISLPLAAKSGKAELQLTLTYGYCREGTGGVCKINTVTWAIPVEVGGEAKEKAIKLAVGKE